MKRVPHVVFLCTHPKGSLLILYQAAFRPDEVNYKVHETLAFQEWIWTRWKPAKRITFI
ncbi:hypothetical protein ALC56_07706 [Trachymyrmex septentrionalis]|uniref:Uncharacterized protein n=1 Tax=Trachymyrmex septentrionalis TaxID=34720 RepID=A0A151JVS2_9HYME|nr:hypothetical protein ALC56_07706 [Trachymyrmex septentrionalis]